MWRRRTKTQCEPEPLGDDFREWAASLPFVVERPHGLSESVRMYAVECEPLHQRSTWLVLDFASGGPRPTSISLLLPRRLASKAAGSGWGTSYVPATAEATGHRPEQAAQVVFHVDPLAGRNHVETLVLGAYRSIIDWT